MDESAPSGGAFRHVRFAGRPTNAVSRSQHRAKSRSPVALRPSERPGQFISWVLERAGLAVENYRGEPLGRRLSPCLRALHAHTEAQARQTLEQRPDLLPTAISTLLIGVTDFFRDEPVFEALRTDVLPQWAHRSGPLRIWSAGCSNGAELYSLAILLAEAGLLEGSFLLGSDCRPDAVAHAQAGVYKSHDLRKIATSNRHRYFEEVGGLWRPIEPVRQHVHWRVSDLARHVEKGPWDMILWRNMAIYLTVEAAQSIWQGLAGALSPEGVLVVGKAERPPAELSLICASRCLYHAGPAGVVAVAGSRPRPTKHRGHRASETSV